MQELIGHHHSVEEICKYIGADSLGYLSIEGMMNIVSDGITGPDKGSHAIPQAVLWFEH